MSFALPRRQREKPASKTTRPGRLPGAGVNTRASHDCHPVRRKLPVSAPGLRRAALSGMRSAACSQARRAGCQMRRSARKASMPTCRGQGAGTQSVEAAPSPPARDLASPGMLPVKVLRIGEGIFKSLRKEVEELFFDFVRHSPCICDIHT